MAFIEIQNLFKRFKKVVAINRIQLEVKKGEMLTLLGPADAVKRPPCAASPDWRNRRRGTSLLTASRCFRKDLSSRQKGESAWCFKTMPYGRI